MNNIANILKNAPKGYKLYSPILGEVTLLEIDKYNNNILVSSKLKKYKRIFDEYGRYIVSDNEDSECLLFPSKEVREWDNFTFRKKYNFKPFDKVIVRDIDEDYWYIDIFSHMNKDLNSEYLFYCFRSCWKQCLPYNEETAKLIGTTDDY